MLCGIKLKLDSRAITQLTYNSAIEFKSLVNRLTGEVDSSRIWSEYGMTILIKSSGYGHIKGSLHKYKNANLHNYDDFTWNEVNETIQKLSDQIGLEVRNLPLIKLEWGLNIPLDFDPNELLTGLVRHRGVAFQRMYVSPGNHYVANHNDYDVKIYNKSAQYGLGCDLIRCELSSNKARYQNKLGIYCLKDLENRVNQNQLFNSLQADGWEDILLIDPLINSFEANPNN